MDELHDSNLDLFESACFSAVKIGQQFTEPDDDWTQVAMMEGERGQAILPLDPLMDDKDLLSQVVLPAAAKMFEATRVVLVFSTWMVTLEPNEDLGDLTPSESPKRKEALVIIEVTREGAQRVGLAFIERHEDAPPTLSEFESMGSGFEGRFVDGLKGALA